MFDRMSKLAELGIWSQRILPPMIMNQFTKKVCTLAGRSTRLQDKVRFGKTYKIKWRDAGRCSTANSLEECAQKYKTLNDFFARDIKPTLKKPQSKSKNAILSPAEAFLRFTETHAENEFTIKEVPYTLTHFLDTKALRIKEASLLIYRLAPQHYHRFHAPFAGTVKSIRTVGGHFKSVDPVMLEHRPVLQENFRVVIEFTNGQFVVAVGATCVGSVLLEVKKGEKVRAGDELGYFEFGGSCVVHVIPAEVAFILRKGFSASEKKVRPGQLVGFLALH